MVCVLVLSSVIYLQGNNLSFRGYVYPLSSSPGLAGTLQYHYNINTKFNFCLVIITQHGINYILIILITMGRAGVINGVIQNHIQTFKNYGGRRYIITQSAHFKLFVNAGIG